MKKKKNNNVPYWIGHRERLRKRALEYGLETLRPHEVLELLLFNARPRVNLTDVARALIVRFGSVGGALSATNEELLSVPGMTKRMANVLQAHYELVSAYADVKEDKEYRVWRFKDMLNYIRPRQHIVKPPQVRVLYTDFDDRVLCCLKFSESTDWATSANAHEMMNNALSMEAEYIYMMSFVGSESLEPKQSELNYLNELMRTLENINVVLMDFIIIGETDIISLRREGLLDYAKSAPESDELSESYWEGAELYEQDSALYDGEPGAF